MSVALVKMPANCNCYKKEKKRIVFINFLNFILSLLIWYKQKETENFG